MKKKKKLINIISMVYFFVCVSVLLEITSYAYIDPSVMTYAIQAIAGVAIAVGAVAGIYWRKAKRKINDSLGIDENKNKEVEDEIEIH